MFVAVPVDRTSFVWGTAPPLPGERTLNGALTLPTADPHPHELASGRLCAAMAARKLVGELSALCQIAWIGDPPSPNAVSVACCEALLLFVPLALESTVFD